MVLWYSILLGRRAEDRETSSTSATPFLISGRGVAIPWPVPSAGLWGVPDWFVGVWVAVLLVLVYVALRVRASRQHREREIGQPLNANRWAVGLFAVGAVISFLVLGRRRSASTGRSSKAPITSREWWSTPSSPRWCSAS